MAMIISIMGSSYQYLHWLQGPNCVSTRAPSLQPSSLHRAFGYHQLLSPEPPLLCHLRLCTGSSSPFKQSQPESIESSRPHLHTSLDWFSRMFSSSFGPSQMDRAFVFHIERSKPRNKHG
ncbi:hypothetical protein F2Q68_00019619 [Brassica cretica]|uniref:Uncharacterized protein n=1 Tax=Brassica cretica TaxID=69181 RepID=A0A8S9G4X2_BRACR|nr:hypothetical protein F2Q68_00019619 [Brassica cretica]